MRSGRISEERLNWSPCAHAAVQENSKFSGLRAPATIDTCSERSPVSGDLLLCAVAPSIAARLPVNSILRTPCSISQQHTAHTTSPLSVLCRVSRTRRTRSDRRRCACAAAAGILAGALTGGPVVRRSKPTTAHRKSFAAARRRALARLRKGLDLQWTPPRSREALHDRAARRNAR